MSANQRFFLREDRYIVDRLNPLVKHIEYYWMEGEPKDDAYLRERVLWRRLSVLVDALIININPMKKLPNGEEYQPHCEEEHSICWTLCKMIEASHLNTLDVSLSIQHRFNGELTRMKMGWQDFTSFSLFVDDVERLLRDLYGEFNNEAINRARDAVRWIVEEFTKHLRKDIWQEHQDAVTFDYSRGIGVPEGYGISSSEHRRGLCAADDLELRARAVRANPEAYSRYTVEFVNELFSKWRSLSHPGEVQPEEEVPL